MLTKCANPECAASFHYLDGKIFQLEIDEHGALCHAGPLLFPPKKPAHVERYWLCPDCAASLTLHYAAGKGVSIAPIKQRSAAAS
jgi:hypothetical protein